jgi:hypothetical protein
MAVELNFMRRRRELLFWTIMMTLAVVVLATMTLAFLVSLVRGATIDGAYMAGGAGIVGLLRYFSFLTMPFSTRASCEVIRRE